MASSLRAELDRLMAEFISTVLAAMRAAPLRELAAAPSGPNLPSRADHRSLIPPLPSRETRPSPYRPTRSRRGTSKHVRITHAERRELRLQQAREWQRQIDAGEISSRAAIARREGLSRARVTQLMNVLSKTR